VAAERHTAEEACFWQDHELPVGGELERPRFGREPTKVLHLRLSSSALRRLRLQAARLGLPLSSYAAAVLLRRARAAE
jgi:predicted DNA binding CopG/RHH family protein